MSALIFALATPVDYETLAAPGDPSAPASITKTIIAGAGGDDGDARADGYLAAITNALPHWRAFGPIGGTPCGVRAPTHATARAHSCRWATNGGPFNILTSACDEGISISNGTVQGSGWNRTLFGATRDGRWVAGMLNASVAAQLEVTNALSGFGWLVRGGQNVANASKLILQIAPTITGLFHIASFHPPEP